MHQCGRLRDQSAHRAAVRHELVGDPDGLQLGIQSRERQTEREAGGRSHGAVGYVQDIGRFEFAGVNLRRKLESCVDETERPEPAGTARRYYPATPAG